MAMGQNLGNAREDIAGGSEDTDELWTDIAGFSELRGWFLGES